MSAEDLAKLYAVCGHDHGHVGHSTHNGQVFNGLMGFAGLAGEDARIAAGDLDVETGLGHDDAHLVEGTLYSDAVSVPAAADAPLGYRPVAMDEVCDR